MVDHQHDDGADDGDEHAVNVEASVNLAGICSDFQIPFAFTSTDLVFDGKKGRYKEEYAKNPLSIYGEQKSIAEEGILKIYPGSTVFRLLKRRGLKWKCRLF